MCLSLSFSAERDELPIAFADTRELWSVGVGPYVLCAKRVRVTAQGLAAFYKDAPLRLCDTGLGVATLTAQQPTQMQGVLYACPVRPATYIPYRVVTVHGRAELSLHAEPLTVKKLREWRQFPGTLFDIATRGRKDVPDVYLLALAPRSHMDALTPSTAVSEQYVVPFGKGEAFKRLLDRAELPAYLKARLRRWMRNTATVVEEAYRRQSEEASHVS